MIEENDANTIRLELVVQLRKSLDKSGSMMLDVNLDAKVRERWTQVNTNTAQVLNQVLRDLQFKDWEKRLKAMEQRKRRLQGTIDRLEKEATVQNGETVQDSARQENNLGES